MQEQREFLQRHHPVTASGFLAARETSAPQGFSPTTLRSANMTVKSMNDLFIHSLRDVYSAEKQILKALPKMIKETKSDELKRAFETHLAETEGQITRLEKVFESCHSSVRGTKCEAIEGKFAAPLFAPVFVILIKVQHLLLAPMAVMFLIIFLGPAHLATTLPPSLISRPGISSLSAGVSSTLPATKTTLALRHWTLMLPRGLLLPRLLMLVPGRRIARHAINLLLTDFTVFMMTRHNRSSARLRNCHPKPFPKRAA
jgi:hypothetical protein